MKYFLSVLFIVNLIICSFLVSLELITRNNGYFLQKFAENNVYQNFSQSREEVQRQFSSVQSYILSEDNKLDTQFFSPEDLIHLRDVHNLYIIMHLVLVINILVLAFLAVKFKAEKIASLTKKTAICFFLLLIFLLVVVNTNFSSFFYRFSSAAFSTRILAA